MRPSHNNLLFYRREATGGNGQPIDRRRHHHNITTSSTVTREQLSYSDFLLGHGIAAKAYTNTAVQFNTKWMEQQ